jgi:hypothetical protein
MNEVWRTETGFLQQQSFWREHRRLLKGSDDEWRMRVWLTSEDMKKQPPKNPAIRR